MTTRAERRIPFWTRIPGPYFFRDVRAAGRRSTTYWTRAAYAGLMFIFVVMFFLGTSMNDQAGASMRIQQMQTFAPMLAMAMAWVQFVALWLVAAAMTGPSICDEVRAGTLATLLTTPLKAWEIILGKLFGSLVQLGILTLMSVPLLLAVRVYGGVKPELILALTSLALSTAFLSASLGLFFSVVTPRPAGAITSAVFTSLFIMLLPVFWMVLLDHFNISLTANLWQGSILGWTITIPSPLGISVVLCPPMALGMVTFELGGGMGMGPLPLNLTLIWGLSSGYTLGVSLIVLSFTSRLLRRKMLTLGEGRADAGGSKAPNLGAARSRTVGDNALVWRELRADSGPRWIRMTGALLAMGLVILAYMLGGVHDWETHMVVGIIGTIVAILLASVHSSGGITGEREARTWEVLLAAPLSAREIIWSKFVGAVKKQWFMPMVVLACLGLVGVGMGSGLGKMHPIVLLHYTMVVVPAILAICALGVFLSLTRRKTAAAASLNFGFWLGVWAVAPFLVGITMGLLSAAIPGDTRWIERILLGVLTLNPVFQVGVAIEGSRVTRWSDQPYSYGPEEIGVGAFTGLCLLSGVVWLVMTGVFLEMSRRKLVMSGQRRW